MTIKVIKFAQSCLNMEAKFATLKYTVCTLYSMYKHFYRKIRRKNKTV